MSNSISYKHMLASLSMSEIILKPFSFDRSIKLFGKKAEEMFAHFEQMDRFDKLKRNCRHCGRLSDVRQSHSGLNERAFADEPAMMDGSVQQQASLLMTACTADVPKEQPQKCHQCIRSQNNVRSRMFPCGYFAQYVSVHSRALP